MPVQAWRGGYTPGYWKNHLDAWPDDPRTGLPILPGDYFEDYFWGSLGPLAGKTLEECLRFGGGPGVDGAKKILARAAVAQLLNSAEFGVVGNVWHVLGEVANALNSEDRATIIDLAKIIDEQNNLPP
ncbi:MAG: hypothetical protein ACFFDT_40095 [Candidatus Hodarchaeota archaeon]